jgi:PAS domain S-box-containing protein
MLRNTKGKLFLLFWVVFLSISFVIYQDKQHKIEQYQASELEYFKLNISKEYETAGQFVSMLSSAVLGDQNIAKQLDTFYQSKQTTQDTIREDIYRKLIEKYNTFSNLSIRKVQIQLKDNRSFLRMDKKDYFGDDLSLIRPTVAYVNNHKVGIDGFEIGRTYDGFRFVQPLFYNDNHVGSIEFSLSSKNMVHNIKESLNSQIAFIIKDNKEMEKLYKEFRKDYVSVPNLNKLAIEMEISQENKELMTIISKLSKSEINDINKNLEEGGSFSTVVYQNFEYKLLQFVPVKIALNGAVGGYFVYGNDMYYLNDLDKNFKMILIALFFVLLIVFNFIAREIETKKILKQKNSELENNWKIIDKYVVFSKTDEDGTIQDVSSAFCDLSGYEPYELKGNSYSMLRHPKTTDEFYEKLWQTLSDNKTWVGFLKNKNKNGENYWIKTVIEPLFDENGKKIGYQNIAVDATDSKSYEKINRTLKKKIKKAVKLNLAQYKQREEEHLTNIRLSSIGALAAGITHEINTPLTYMKGNFEMMKYDILDLENNESLKENLLSNYKRIYDGILRISNIIEAMREVASTPKDDVKSEVNIYNTLITALTMVHNKAKQISKITINGNNFDLNMEHTNIGNCIITIHKQRVEQVWIVIMNNALDELVKIENYEERELNITIDEQEDKFTIFFKDNAGGIDEKIIQNLFDPFISTKESGGMGIGLSIAKKIIESNNGTIEAYNEEKKAVFKITFPKNIHK